MALTADDIRKMRGSLTRAEFAARAHVTPLTVYRWELPEGSSEARRPRGRVLAALLRAFGEVAPSGSEVEVAAFDPSEHERLLPMLEQLFRGQWRRCEEELLALLVSDRLRSGGARAAAAAIFALVQVLGRHDLRAAFTTLRPALVEADAGSLPPEAELLVRVAGAQVFAYPDGQLYDMGRVSAQVARAEQLLSPESSPDLRFLASSAVWVAALHEWRADLLPRMLEKMEAGPPSDVGVLGQLIGNELKAHTASFTGRASLALARFRECAAAAEQAGLPVLQVRALASLARQSLDASAEPDEVLVLCRRARDVARSARLGLGMHSLLLPMAEAEALLRQAQLEAAREVLADAEATAADMKWSPVMAGHGQLRLLGYAADGAGLRALGTRLASHRGPLEPATGAMAAQAAGLAELHGGDAAAAVRGLEEALRRSSEGDMVPVAVRGLLGVAAFARLFAGAPEEVERALRRADAFLERYPAPWDSAVLRRCEGLWRFTQGQLEASERLLEVSLGTLVMAKDAPEAALSRHCLKWVSRHRAGGVDGGELEASLAELARLGVRPLPLERLPVASVASVASVPVAAPAPSPLAELVVAVDRLAVRGVGPELILKELVAWLTRWLPGRTVRLEALDAESSDVESSDERPGLGARFELGDGLGRRYRLAVGGELASSTVEQVRLLTRAASQSLEIACLRGFGGRSAPRPSGGGEAPAIPGLVAASAQMREIAADLTRLASSRSTVILTGESGTGKEVVAEAIHRCSSRAGQPYVTFNCAAVPRELFEGQLFGHRKGAFTGATAEQRGVIRAADGGTLFLDEIAELPLELQPKLLRFLENREVATLGEPRPALVDVRVIAATHRDLEQLVRAGGFRQDLYYRLQVICVRIPPLRERPEDIVALARHFARTLTPEGVDPPALAPDAVSALLAQRWPGNARELRNVLERALAYSPPPPVLTAGHLRL